MTSALFVDLANFYSHLLESKIDDTRVLRDYFLNWLDFDRLASYITKGPAPVWIFYSGRKFGPRSNRVENEHLNKYIDRINKLKGVTAYDANIPSDQRETGISVCTNCGQENRIQYESEKGVDASLIVHLFDTMDSWDNAYLLSGDADFVPGVASLRRRGKIVIGVGFPNVSAALIRECYDYIDILNSFLKYDIAIYNLFKKDGIIDNWMNYPVVHKNKKLVSQDNIVLAIQFENWNSEQSLSQKETKLGILVNSSPNIIYLVLSGSIDVRTRRELIEEFQRKFPYLELSMSKSDNSVAFSLGANMWDGVMRRFDEIITYLGINKIRDTARGKSYSIQYSLNSSGEYEKTKNLNLEYSKSKYPYSVLDT
jgi:uncharacterized LabA/DUF88 family protein